MNKWEIYNDNELMELKQTAIEMRDLRWIKAINAEINRRNRDE
nr:MAG TPA: Sda, KinA, antikinase, histidine kinase [Bacteriophage sp.]